MTDKEADEIITTIRLLSLEERGIFLRKLAEYVCLVCGENAPCFCDPAYDE